MKISGEMLAVTIDDLKGTPKNDAEHEIITTYLNNRDDIISALQELQQLHEERRWRKLGVDEPEANVDYQVSFGGKTDFRIWQYDGDTGAEVGWFFGEGAMSDSGIAEQYIARFKDSGFYFRPLPTDLPEVE